MPIQK